MRIIIKGGVWKNTEDEILKAAVMKYGKNQWARVASLLNRKSGKQCKARWYEWLDPSIKKTEWSKEEEEKLLHLAKLMPNQWRTIAPIVGRTAAQCMDQYERLLDQAQEHGQEQISTDDPRRLRPGEIDPAPETKPARPDPIDMDEDEKEMLSEARARLANTKGKKAKRKARERQLEESRRLSMLQKRRELKAAGVESKLGVNGRGKRKYIDYAREIPFQMVPPSGFYDVGEEIEKGKQMKFDPVANGMELSKLDGRTQRIEEARQQAKDEKKLKALFKANAPLAVLTLSNSNDPTALRRRSALSLPSPQVSDAELEDIVKVGQRALMPPPEGTISATQSLIGNYANAGYRPDQTPGTVQRTPLREDTIMQEARNQRMMREMTPFLAAEAEDIELPELAEGTGFEGVTPRASRLATPNVVLQKSQVPGTPISTHGNSSTASTTGSLRSSSNQTPLRDQFGLNSSHARSSLTKGLMSGTPLNRVGGGSSFDDDSYSISETDSVTSTKMSEKQRIKHQRAMLAAKLGNLPEPEYTYEVVIPEVENEDEIDQKNQPEDTAEIQLKLKREKELNEQKELLRRSQVIQRQLPRPVSVNYNLAKSFYDTSTTVSSEIVDASSLIGQEMVQLIAHDEYKHLNPTEKRKTRPQIVELETIDDHYLNLAKKAIAEESATDSTRPSFNSVEFGLKAEEISKQKLFVPSTSGGGRYIPVNEASKQDVLTALTNQHAALKVKIQKDVKKSLKLENKITVMTQGYSLIADKLKTNYLNSVKEYYTAATEYDCLQDVSRVEQRVLQRRVAAAREYLTTCEESEKALQNRYASLRNEYDSLSSGVSA